MAKQNIEAVSEVSSVTAPANSASTSAKADGHAGARKAAADLTIALCAEAVAASLNEEAAKVDFKITFRSLFGPRSLLSVHCQVKSGVSYAAVLNKGNVKLATMKDTVYALQLGTQPSLIIWVEPKPRARVFWHIIRPRYPKRTRITIPTTDVVSPTLYVDLCRYSRFFVGAARPAQLQCSQGPVSKVELRCKAKHVYRSLQISGVSSYLASNIEVTRLGWRHITRRSRAATKRETSFRLVPYLKRLLQMRPSRFLVTNKHLTKRGEWCIERRDILYWYDRAISIDGVISTVMVRISEEIEYPIEWRTHGLSESDIKISAKLLSWWCKPTKMVVPRSSVTDTDADLTPPRVIGPRMVENTTVMNL